MLKRMPTESDIARMYYELAVLGARCVGTFYKWPYPDMEKHELVAVAADMSRYDPRLLDVLVEYFIDNYKEVNPAKIRALYPQMETKQVFGVIAEFMKAVCREPEVFYYAQYLTSGLEPVPAQFFFHNLYQIAGTLARRASETPLTEYKKWGFLASEKPSINRQKRISLGSLDVASRLNVLKQLLEKKEIIQISDYLKALNNTVSRQQALIDLSSSGVVRKIGHGRGAKWKRTT